MNHLLVYLYDVSTVVPLGEREEGRKEGEGEEGETWETERGREGDRENGGRKGLGRKAAGGREKERETCVNVQVRVIPTSHWPSPPLFLSSSPRLHS